MGRIANRETAYNSIKGWFRERIEIRLTKTLYVGNLPWTTKEEELAEAFGQVANVHSSRIITDRVTGRSRGFGFVEVDDTDAEKAIDALNGADFNGRALIVNEAKEREQ